ncbi:1-aminocyclopropane-1-carboxylate deaminase/D-cysteine desulfhydrase [Pseudomonas schmalbachii]|uniref:1-aminocyclopropane-1-carboxylate deaminase n=1 Tax=Pseudomonas schmalbachii TaxID=2816993 RepID=A0ABS3TSD1_9PSED|nr:1-aminocyclopropane-1-carboxylate deaminase [Pseudomonas schmalbachii]MBO3276543.1 1-aminocyclopropane-1-carboxylate deaminase [Pseudomonas schmalbachii]
MQHVRLDWLDAAGVELALLRLDLVDEQVSGNKWFKLAPYLRQAADLGLRGLISLGGAHSNHLHALAAAGARFGFETAGLLRGLEQDTPTVRDLRDFGMDLHWLGYAGYRERHAPGFWAPWRERYPHLLPVDEGGGGLPGAQGCAGLVGQLRAQLPALGWADYHQLWVAAGSGTTLAGLVSGEDGAHEVVGAMAVPPGHGVEGQVPRLLQAAGRADEGYRLIDASRGGFARLDARLARFMAEFQKATGVPLEPLYTGKLLLALHDEVQAGRAPRGSRIVAVHSGGLQGLRALQERLDKLSRSVPLL